MELERRIEILSDVKWRLESIFCYFTDDRESALDNQFKAWDDFLPIIERYLDEFSVEELDTDPLALLLMDEVYDEVDLIREGSLHVADEKGRHVWGLYMENIEDPEKADITTWEGDYPCQCLEKVREMLARYGMELDPPRWCA